MTTYRSNALQNKINHLKKTPLRDLKGTDFWFLTTEDKSRFGESPNPDEQDPFGYYTGTKPTPQNTRELSGIPDGQGGVPQDPVSTILRIRSLMRALLAGCIAMAIPLALLPRNIWNWLPLVAGFSAIAWWIARWLEDKADAAYNRALTVSLTNAQVASDAWVMTRWLGSAFDLIKNSPVLIRRFEILQGVSDESDPNGFDHILAWLRDAGVVALENFASRHVRGSNNNLLTAEGRFDGLLKQCRCKDEALKHRWLWGLNNYKQVISAVSVISGIPASVIVVMEAARLFVTGAK